MNNCVALFLACSLMLICSSGGMAQEVRNQSKLSVSFKVKGGRLIVDRNSSGNKFAPSEAFKSLGDKTDAGYRKTLQALFDDLDKVFAQLPRLYWYALTNDEKNLDQSGKLADDSTRNVRNYTGSWDGFRDGPFLQWSKGNAARSLSRVFSQMFSSGDFATALDNTALIFFPQDDDTFELNYNPKSGSANFQVADPVTDWGNKSDYTICFPLDINDTCSAGETDPEARVVRSLLGALKSKLWRPVAIRSGIEEYYVERGLLPTVNLSAASQYPRYINIQKSLRVGRIILPDEGVDDRSIDKILYLLLDDADFRFYVNSDPRPIGSDQYSIPSNQPADPPQIIKYKYVDYLSLGRGRKVGDEPLLSQLELQGQQLQLAQLGFEVTEVASGGVAARAGGAYIDLSVVRMTGGGSASDAKKANAPDTAVPLANEQGVIDPRRQKPEYQTEPVPSTPSVASAAGGANQSGAEKKNNYLGGGFDYRPGQGVRFIGIYQRSLPGAGSLSLQAGGQGSALGSVNYFTDFALFGAGRSKRRFYRRLSLQFTGSSDFEASRRFAAVETDERRTGGLARAELELFRDLGGHLLRLSAEGRRSTVELIETGETTSKQKLTTLELGSFYIYEGDQLRYPAHLRLEPRLKLGLGLASDERRFTAFSLVGNYHRRLPRMLEADISGRLEQASEATPIFEQPSFGGAEVLRGFRRDDAIGRRLWSLQNELWAPVPATGNFTEGAGLFVKRNVRLAGFVDVGGVYQTTGSRPGVKVGPGVGVRMIYNLAVFKLDWAYGLGDTGAGRGHGRFYFSITFNTPF